MYDPLESHRFPKRHEFVVQECRILDVREVVAWLGLDHPRVLERPAIRVRGLVAPYRGHQATAACEAAACPSCDGDGCPDCNRSGCRCRGAGCMACTTYGGNRVGDLVQARRRGSDGCDLLLMRRQLGAAQRWNFLCPTCRRPCEYLHLPPKETVYREREDSIYAPARGNWRCRRCWNLNYASQHYGRTHALRRQLSPRRVLSHRRRAVEQNRRRRTRLAVSAPAS